MLLKSPVSELDLSVGPLLLFLVSFSIFHAVFLDEKNTFNDANLPPLSTLKRERLAEAVVMMGIILSLCNLALALQ